MAKKRTKPKTKKQNKNLILLLIISGVLLLVSFLAIKNQQTLGSSAKTNQNWTMTCKSGTKKYTVNCKKGKLCVCDKGYPAGKKQQNTGGYH